MWQRRGTKRTDRPFFPWKKHTYVHPSPATMSPVAPRSHFPKQLGTQTILKNNPVICPWLRSSSKKPDNDASFPSLLSCLQGPLGKDGFTSCRGTTPTTEGLHHCLESSKCQCTTNWNLKKTTTKPKPQDTACLQLPAQQSPQPPTWITKHTERFSGTVLTPTAVTVNTC